MMPTVVVAVVLVVGVGVLVAEHLARTRLLERIRAAIEVAARAPTTLDVPHRPLLLHAVRRRVPSAHLVFTDLPVADGAGHLTELRVDLDDLALTGRRLRPDLRAAAGTWVGRLDAATLNAIVTLPPGLSRVEATADGFRLRTAAGIAVDTSVEVTSRGIRVSARGGLLRLLPTTGWTVPLPDLPYGATVREVEPLAAGVRVRGDLDPDHLVFRADVPATTP